MFVYIINKQIMRIYTFMLDNLMYCENYVNCL